MIDLNPEVLMAYVDGELDAEQKSSVEALIARDPEARAMVNRFRHSADQLRKGFDDILDLPVPPHLIDTIRNHKPDPSIVPLTRLQGKTGLFRWPSLALAASVALFVGILAGVALLGGPAIEAPTVLANLLQETLELQPSGTSQVSDDALEAITPISTFHTTDGRVCREFQRQSHGRKTVGIACRDTDGQWVALVEIDHALLAADPGVELEYMPASGSADPLAAALSALRAGPVLTTAEEQRLRSQGWQ